VRDPSAASRVSPRMVSRRTICLNPNPLSSPPLLPAHNTYYAVNGSERVATGSSGRSPDGILIEAWEIDIALRQLPFPFSRKDNLFACRDNYHAIIDKLPAASWQHDSSIKSSGKLDLRPKSPIRDVNRSPALDRMPLGARNEFVVRSRVIASRYSAVRATHSARS